MLGPSQIGGIPRPVTTAAHTHPSRQSASLQQSSSALSSDEGLSLKLIQYKSCLITRREIDILSPNSILYSFGMNKIDTDWYFL